MWAKYLPLLYGDSKRWGMTFQMEALHWFNKLRTQILPELLSQKVIIVERSPQSSTKIFARNMFSKNHFKSFHFGREIFI